MANSYSNSQNVSPSIDGNNQEICDAIMNFVLDFLFILSAKMILRFVTAQTQPQVYFIWIFESSQAHISA